MRAYDLLCCACSVLQAASGARFRASHPFFSASLCATGAASVAWRSTRRRNSLFWADVSCAVAAYACGAAHVLPHAPASTAAQIGASAALMAASWCVPNPSLAEAVHTSAHVLLTRALLFAPY